MKLIFHIKSQKYDFVTVSSVPYFWGEEPVHNFTAENQITPTCPPYQLQTGQWNPLSIWGKK